MYSSAVLSPREIYIEDGSSFPSPFGYAQASFSQNPGVQVEDLLAALPICPYPPMCPTRPLRNLFPHRPPIDKREENKQNTRECGRVLVCVFSLDASFCRFRESLAELSLLGGYNPLLLDILDAIDKANLTATHHSS